MKRWFPSLAEDGICLLLLVCLALLALYPVVFDGKVPLAVDGLLSQAPWEEARPPDLEAPSDPAAAAEAAEYYPAYAFIHDTAQRGDSLLWNPLENGGEPFFAAWRSRCLSPFTIPFYVFPLPFALRLSALLKVVAAAWFAFYAARRLGLRGPSALLVGTAYELSAAVLLWMGDPLSDVVPWIPLFFIYAERLALGQVRYWPMGALVGGLMLLGGGPEAAAGAFLFFGCYTAVRVLFGSQPTPRGLPLLALASSILLAVGLVAVQVVPFVELVQQSYIAEGPPRAFPGLGDAVSLVLARFFAEVPGAVASGNSPVTARELALVHLGLVQILLAALWISLRHCVSTPHRRRIDALLGTSASLLFLTLAFGRFVPGLPLAKFLGPEHFLIANGLAFALGGAATAEAWLELNPDQCHSALKRLAVVMPLLLLLAFAAVYVSFDDARGRAPDFVEQVLYAVAAALLFFGLLAITLLRPSGRLLGYGLALVTVLDLFTSFRPLEVFSDEDRLFPATEFVQALQETGSRVGGSEVLEAWPLAGNGIAQVRGVGRMTLKRHAAFLEKARSDPQLLGRAACPTLLLTKEDIQGAFAALRPKLRIRHVFPTATVLFDNTGVYERARLVHEGRPVDEFDPNELDSALPPLLEDPGPFRPSNGAAADRVTIGAETNSRVAITVENATPGVLVLADSHYPGWRAKIDGKPARVFPVDGTFRGVLIGGGVHEVEFYYDPASLKLGLGITAATALIVAAGLLNLLRQRLPFLARPRRDAT